jgi:hypothetical protein
MISKEDEIVIRRLYMALEQRSDPQPAAAQQVDVSSGYPSQLENEHASEGWNMRRGPPNQRWNADQLFAPPSYISTPPRSHYDPQTSAGIVPSSLSISDPIVPYAYTDCNFDNPANFSFQDSVLEVSQPLNIALMMTLDSNSLSGHNNSYPEDHQNTSDSGSGKNYSGKKPRKRLTAQEREEARNTRDIIACIRCHQQHIKVSGHLALNTAY